MAGGRWQVVGSGEWGVGSGELPQRLLCSYEFPGRQPRLGKRSALGANQSFKLSKLFASETLAPLASFQGEGLSVRVSQQILGAPIELFPPHPQPFSPAKPGEKGATPLPPATTFSFFIRVLPVIRGSEVPQSPFPNSPLPATFHLPPTSSVFSV